MIELTFIQYQEKLKIEKTVSFPTEHVWQDEEYIFMFFRSREKLDYYTLISKEDIIEFANQFKLSDDDPVKDFLMNYCSTSFPIKEPPIWIPSQTLDFVPTVVDKKNENVQTIIASKKVYDSRAEAKSAVKAKGYKTYTSRETETSYRFRQRPPSDFVEGSFKTYSIGNGLSKVVGKLKESEKNYEISKPASVERCVESLMNDPDFKAQPGKTKEESAWAVCQSKNKSCDKSVQLIDAEDIVKESKTYEEFLIRLFDRFEKETLKSVNKINKEKKLNKNFGEFLTDLFNIVNSAKFATSVEKFLRADLDEGRIAAQKELNVDLPFNEAFDNKLKQLYQEQINGYTINGKKWFGIKGVTKEIQQKVIETVQSGLNENKTNKEIAEDVKSTFSDFTDWRSQMIARTETNRIINEGLIVGYKESGIEGGKGFSAALDNRTSPICERLHKKYANKSIGLDEPFIDDEGEGATMKSFDSPPCHPHCRSRVFFKVK